MSQEQDLKKWVRDDIVNDAVFGNVMGKKENCLQLLQAILPEKNIHKIVDIQRQKHISLKMLRKATRFDVLATDDQKQKYDIEMQTTGDPALLKRALFYQGRIGDEQLMQGADYKDIKASYVIFFCTFDPFGFGDAKNEVMYVLKNHPKFRLKVNQHIIFFNIKALKKDGLTKDLQDFLDYLDGKINIRSSFIKRLEKDRHDYINGKEWKNFMLDFKRFEEETTEKATKLEKIRNLKMMIATLRSFGISDENILQKLIENYGKDYSTEQLKSFLARK